MQFNQTELVSRAGNDEIILIVNFSKFTD